MPSEGNDDAAPVRNSDFGIRISTEVAAGLVFRNGLLLITQRRPQDHLGGMWEFPGGKRHEGETFEDCLKRELMEELEIEVEVGELIDTILHEYSDRTVQLKFYRCSWKRNEPRAIGVQDFAWVGQGQLGGYTFPEADQKLLEKLNDGSELWK